jgi:hypothetical protein
MLSAPAFEYFGFSGYALKTQSPEELNELLCKGDPDCLDQRTLRMQTADVKFPEEILRGSASPRGVVYVILGAGYTPSWSQDSMSNRHLLWDYPAIGDQPALRVEFGEQKGHPLIRIAHITPVPEWTVRYQ